MGYNPAAIKEGADKYVACLNQKDIEGLSELIDNGCFVRGAGPKELTKQEWLDVLQVMFEAFPDLNFNISEVMVEGIQAITGNQLKGTHTGPLNLAVLGIDRVVDPTGREFLLDPGNASAYIYDGKVRMIELEGPGLIEILAQLGIDV